MKKIRILTLALIATLASCNDAKDITQDGIISDDNVWESLEDLQLGLNGAYGAYNPEGAINFNALITDNLKRGQGNNGQGQGLYNFNLIPGTSEASGIWTGRLSLINRVNRVLSGVEKLEFENSSDQDTEDHIEAQLLALRAMAHLDLFLYYTEDYSAANSMSIPNVDYVPEISAEPVRNTVEETLSFIKNDLNDASSKINDETSDNFYINKNAIKALKAKIALLEEDFPKVITLTSELIADYPLSDRTEYEEMYQDAAPGESILTIARGPGDARVASLFYFNEVSINGDPYLEVSNGLYNELDPNDIRFDVTIHPETQISGVNSEDNIILINKYPGSVEPLVNDIKLIRSSEMLLLRAEAKARNNDLPGAASDVQTLRNARFSSTQALPNYADLNAALIDILKERRLEFAFEGKRYLDLKRIGKDLNLGVTRNNTDCNSFSAPCDLPRNSHKFTLPIPQVELNANSKIQQNTGY
ncbi:MAG: RagB/SusD family nutrient uptake outer membrane protein [Psychroflexus halocasei]